MARYSENPALVAVTLQYEDTIPREGEEVVWVCWWHVPRGVIVVCFNTASEATDFVAKGMRVARLPKRFRAASNAGLVEAVLLREAHNNCMVI